MIGFTDGGRELPRNKIVSAIWDEKNRQRKAEEEAFLEEKLRLEEYFREHKSEKLKTILRNLRILREAENKSENKSEKPQSNSEKLKTIVTRLILDYRR